MPRRRPTTRQQLQLTAIAHQRTAFHVDGTNYWNAQSITRFRQIEPLVKHRWVEITTTLDGVDKETIHHARLTPTGESFVNSAD